MVIQGAARGARYTPEALKGFSVTGRQADGTEHDPVCTRKRERLSEKISLTTEGILSN
jgi:hypothetical protein